MCVLVLVIQHEQRMCRGVLSSLACLGFLRLSKLSYFTNDTIFGKYFFEYEMCASISPQLLSEIFRFLRLIFGGIINKFQSSLYEVPIIPVRFSLNLDFRRILKREFFF